MKKRIFKISAIIFILVIITIIIVFNSATPGPKGQLLQFSYSFGSFNGGEWNYEIHEESGKLFITAKGYNGILLELEKEVPDDTLDKIAVIIQENEIYKWNRFNGYDDSVLDGYSFSLNAVFEDGDIKAEAYEKYPKNYDEGHTALAAYLEELAPAAER